MKKTVFLTLLIALASLLACQHELSWDTTGSGTLKKDAAGNCLPVAVAGNFVRNKILTDSNFLTVEVYVKTTGYYLVTTNTVNGYSFKSTGTFSRVGNETVRLAASGKPLVSDTDHFTINFQNSICEAVVPVASDTVAKAVFSIQGSPGKCMDDTVKGYYIKGVSLDLPNKVIVKVNVAATGTFSILTDTINGYAFSASGTFTKTGIQAVALAGNGTPAAPGNDKFIVTAGASTCSFINAVAPVVAVINQEYFPLTEGSLWTYNAGVIPGDTMLRIIKGDTTIEKLKYAKMFETTLFRNAQYLFNLNVNDYTEYGAVDKYTSSFQYGSTVNGLLPFLKERLSTGQSWESAEFKGVASFGQVLFNKYLYRCTNDHAAITLNGRGFANVYVITVYPSIRSESNPYGSTGEIYNYYYAKGIGLIYLTKFANGFEQVMMEIRSWHVN